MNRLKIFVWEKTYRFFNRLEQFAQKLATKANDKILASSGKPYGRVISYDELCEQTRWISSMVDEHMALENPLLKRLSKK